MGKYIKTRKGNDGFYYPYTSPDLVIDEDGKSTTTKFSEINTQLENIGQSTQEQINTSIDKAIEEGKMHSDASKLSIIDENNNFMSDNVEGALEELNTQCKDIANQINENYFILKSPNGTQYKIKVTDNGTLKVIGVDETELEGLLENRILLWNEDFEGTEVDLNTWTFDNRDKYGALLNSWTGGANTTVKDSILNIKAVKQKHGNYSAEWSSDQLWTRKKYANNPCRFECKMKFDVMNGCWPAFWLMGDNFTGTGPEAGQGGLGWPTCGELDIMEFMGGANGNLSCTAHWSNLVDAGHQSKGIASYTNKITGNLTDWHIYGCEITDTQVTFDVDGTTFATWNISDANVDFGNAFNMPMYPLISLQVGQSGGTPDDDATEMNVYVDWVRCYAPVDTVVYGDVESMSITGINTTVAPEVTQVATVEFTPFIANNKTLNWSSSNESVATVKNGVITSISDGESIITATSKNGISTSITISVESTASYPVESLAFDKTWFPVVIGNTYTPNLKITPDYATENITYSSSNESVFTVNNSTGEITPISHGNAILTATSDSGVTTNMSIDIVPRDENAYIHATFNGTRYQNDTGVGNCTKLRNSFELQWDPRDAEYTLVMILTNVNRCASLGFSNVDGEANTGYKPTFVHNYNEASGNNYIGVYSERTFETINLNDLTLPTTLKLAYVVKNNTISYYKNGVLFGSHEIVKNINNSGVKTPTTHLSLMALSTTGTSEMLFYRRALSDTEVIEITRL